MRRPFLFCVLSALFIVPQPQVSRADVRLPGFYGDHMVLQQATPLRFWGWADPAESIEVTLGDQTSNTVADADGRWRVTLPAMRANRESQTLQFRGKNSIELRDILIGEVWLCSGQSNMEWTVQGSRNADVEIEAADHPLIRHMKVAHRSTMLPQDDIDSVWTICSPKTVANYTAVGFFMARRLHEQLDVPIGLINASWGGTRVEPWTPPVGFADVPALREIHASVLGRTPGTERFRKRLARHIAATEAWLEDAKTALTNNRKLSPSPPYPETLQAFRSHQDPTMLFNGMIHALVGFPIRGTIWYQGESNHTEGMQYLEKKRALIGGWRKLWDQGDFPFYFVQIAPFQYGQEDPTILAKFWEAQARVTTEVPNTAMVVINDVATLQDIHPPNKQAVGLRLANLALQRDYGQSELAAENPQMKSMDVKPGVLDIHFQHTAGGLRTRDGGPPSHFELIGRGSGGFQPAVASISGNTVTLRADNIAEPLAFRFAWDKLAEPNLVGGGGLPVGAFRGGNEPKFLDTVQGADEYELIYDLDLHTLGPNPGYEINRSDQDLRFDRVGYLLELRSSNYGEQNVFVSMRAFTSELAELAIPTITSGARFQTPVEDLRVFSNVKSLASLTGTPGNLEFWPDNYRTQNASNVPEADSDVYDSGDQPAAPQNGYGSMQIHANGRTIFAINNWNGGRKADLGIGNSPGRTRDWTFTANAGNYTLKRLRVYVRPR